MPNLPFWRRHHDQADAEQLDQLLDAGQFDAAANPEWQSVSDVLRSAAAAAEPAELASEAATLAAFRRESVGIRHRRPQPIARYKTVIANRFSTLLPRRLAVGLAGGVVILTGAATAAYASVLPSPIQSFAHTTIGAPRPSSSNANVAAVEAANRNHHPTPSVSVSPTPSVSVSAAAVTASMSAHADGHVDVVGNQEPKGQELDPAQLAAIQALVDYRLCQSYTALTKIGKTLDPKALAILVKAAGSSTPATIAAYCAALPVPPSPCLAQPVPTASPSPSTTPSASFKDNDKFIKGGDWWRWCGVCPQATASPTPTARPPRRQVLAPVRFTSSASRGSGAATATRTAATRRSRAKRQGRPRRGHRSQLRTGGDCFRAARARTATVSATARRHTQSRAPAANNTTDRAPLIRARQIGHN